MTKPRLLQQQQQHQQHLSESNPYHWHPAAIAAAATPFNREPFSNDKPINPIGDADDADDDNNDYQGANGRICRIFRIKYDDRPKYCNDCSVTPTIFAAQQNFYYLH